MNHQIRVLICEDSIATAAGIKAALEHDRSIKVVGVAANGEVALRMINEMQPNVVLMDIGMPVLDGIVATRCIADRWPEIQVLILSTSDDEDSVRKSLAAGARGYCLKQTPSVLPHAIAAAMSGASWLAPQIATRLFENFLSPLHSGVAADTASLDRPNPLTGREREVLALIVDGYSNTEIAARLVVSSETVKSHVKKIFEKLHVRDRTEAAVKAVKFGLIAA